MLRKIVIYSAFIFLTIQYVNSVTSEPNEKCLWCICFVVSKCNMTYGCNTENQCGPFRITMPFWIDAESPVLLLDNPKSPGAFSRCAVDPTCSAKAVSNYVKTYSFDCNGDGKVDCIDYLHIHQHGGGDSCTKTLSQPMLEKFKTCLKEN